MPLLQNDADNSTTVILEAMGKRGGEAVLRDQRIDSFVEVVRATVADVIREYREGAGPVLKAEAPISV